MTVSRSKAFAGALAAALVSFIVVNEARAAATVCNNGAIATIDIGDCTVVAGTIPTTVVFTSNESTLFLNGAVPTGAVTTAIGGQGKVVVQSTVTSAADFGNGGGGRLDSLTVNDGTTLNLQNSFYTSTIAVGQGTSGVLNQSAGIISREVNTTTPTALTIGAGGAFTQSGTGVLYANTTIATGGALTLVNQGGGTIDGAGAGQGALTFAGNYNTDAAIGTTSLASVTVNNGVTLTLDQNLSATTVNVGTGASGVVNQSAGTLTATTLAIKAGGTVTQSGTGVIHASNTTIATGGTLTVVNQGTGGIQGAGTGQGSLIIAGNYNTDSHIGSTSLAAVTINDGVTLTLDRNLAATTVTVGTGTSGIVNQTVGEITANTLAIAAGGTLVQSSGGTIRATNTTIATGGALTLVNHGTGAIDGAGAGQGALTIAGNYNTDAALGATNSLASITVNDGVTLTLDQNARATTVNVGQGASGVVNQSAGTLTATTLAIKAGGTFAQSGTGVINATNTTIATGGALTLAGQGTGTINGAGAGQGALTFAGNYNTDSALGGANALASITVNDGVTLTLDQNASAATVNVGQGASGAVTHSTGTLTATTLAIKSGAIFNQTGAGGITAATTIQDGGTMNVTSAFTHTGALTVGGGTSGTLDLAGNTLTASSTFAMNAGATLKTTINTDAANDSGRIVATGTATINAATTINITVTPGTLTSGRTFVIVQGAGGGSVSVPTTITDNSATYTFTGSTDGNSLTLTVGLATSGTYVTNTTSSNAGAAATVLDAISSAGATGDMATVISTLDGLSGASQGAAIATTVPDVSGAMTSTGLSVQTQSLGVVTSRLAALRDGQPGGASGVSSGNSLTNAAIWGQAFGITATQDRRKGFDGYDADTVGFAFGGDKLLDSNDWTVGLAYSYAVSNLNYAGSRAGNGGDIESQQGTVYASFDGGPYYIDILGSIARNNYDTTRKVVVGAINRTAMGDFNGMQYGAKVGGGYDFEMGGGWTFTPTASLQATHLSLDSYTETGAGSLNLAVKSQDYNSVQSGLGVKETYVVDAGDDGGKLTASVHAIWLYDVKSVRQESTSSYTGGGGSFVTEGPKPARNAANLGVALDYDLGTGFSVAATYDAEIKDEYLSHSATATARMEF